ncbi:MAG: hypothetical protein QOI98_1017, partial [Solirubrobacteraceae bacterium]|nr:hypothetical protein [Solirubrobacteraceae bacterium]
MRAPIRRRLIGWFVSAALVAAVSGVLELLQEDPSGSTVAVLYLFAVMPVALVWGTAFGVLVAVASTVAYDYLFVPPLNSLTVTDSRDWLRLAGFLAAALIVSGLAARWRESTRLAAEQAAVRRVATLVARGTPPPDVFAAVARELGVLLGIDTIHIGRYEHDGTATGVAAWSLVGDHMPVGRRVKLEGDSVAASVLRIGRPARMDSYEHAAGPGAALGRELGLRSSVGAPIVVDGGLWGVMMASSKDAGPLPAATESRIAAFSELVATAISNAEARAEVGRLADEQAALRRVATLVARGVPQAELFGAVTEEVGTLLRADLAAMIRYENDATVTPMAAWSAAGEQVALPDRWPIDEGDPVRMIAKTRRAARIDDWNDVPGPISALIRDIGISSSVGRPILVEGRLWGALVVHTNQPMPLPTDTSISTGTGVREASASTPARRPPWVRAAGRMPWARSPSSTFARLASS